jgi:hypothetical protein
LQEQTSMLVNMTSFGSPLLPPYSPNFRSAHVHLRIVSRMDMLNLFFLLSSSPNTRPHSAQPRGLTSPDCRERLVVASAQQPTMTQQFGLGGGRRRRRRRRRKRRRSNDCGARRLASDDRRDSQRFGGRVRPFAPGIAAGAWERRGCAQATVLGGMHA